MMNLPDSWAQAALEELFDTVLGGDWGKDPHETVDDSLLVRCVRAAELRDWESERGKSAAIRRLKRSSVEKRRLRSGDILVEVSGGGPDQAVGRSVLITSAVLNIDRSHDFVCTNFFRFCRTVHRMNASYLNWYLQYFYATGGTEALQGGSNNLRNLRFPDFLAQQVPIAPFNEQKRIVAKIEELFSELDKAVESLAKAREQLKAYRQSVLKAAFEGKLTQRWRRRHLERLDGAGDLEGLLKANGSVNAKRVPATDLQDAADLPEEWAYFRVASLCSVVRGGSPRPAGDPKYYDGHIPFLKVADLTHATGMHLSTHTSTIKEAGLTKTRMTPPNTLLISNSGATLGVPKICTFEATFNDGVAAFLGVPQGYLEYLYFFWESKTAQLRGIDQGAAQPNLNTSILGETLIPICSKDEAVMLVELLKELLSNIERQTDEIDRNLAQAAALRQSILKRAFSGQLVAQDAADEPASVLLERIRADRQERSGSTKHTKKKAKSKEDAA
jgi:type I restriction enzyme S subunit